MKTDQEIYEMIAYEFYEEINPVGLYELIQFHNLVLAIYNQEHLL